MKTIDYNLIKEIFKYKTCNDYKDFIETCEDLKKLLSTNIICVDILTDLINKPKSYINNILKSVKNKKESNKTSNKEDNNQLIKDIVNNLNEDDLLTSQLIIKDEKYKKDVLICKFGNVIINEEFITAYDLYVELMDKYNIKVITNENYDYVACVIKYLNNIYDSETDLIFSDILKHIDNIIMFEFKNDLVCDNTIYITNDIINNVPLLHLSREDNNILMLVNNDNIENNSDYKETILKYFTPKKKINKYKLYSLFCFVGGGCLLFDIYGDENESYIYTKNNNWLIKEKNDLETCDKKYMTKLQLYELQHKMELYFMKEYNKILNTSIYETDFKKSFKLMDIKPNIITSMTTKTFLISDILEKCSIEHGKKHTTHNKIYPYLTSTCVNNSVSNYVNYYMIDSDNKPVITICLANKSTGFASVHKGKFAYNLSIALLTKKDNKKANNLNIYNIAFAISETFKAKHITKGLTIDKIMRTKIKVII